MGPGAREEDVSDEGEQQGLEAGAEPSEERIEGGVERGEGAPADAAPSLITGPITFGENFAKKVRKHIDQVRSRGPVKEDIPPPGRGGLERVERIIRDRVARGAGRATTYAGGAAVAFEDGGVTYIFRTNGEFWIVLGN